MNRLTHIARATAFAGLISGCVAMSAPAFAAEDGVLPQGTLSLRGADFTSAPAVARLKRHLRHVAMDICTANAGNPRFMDPSEQACYDTALKDGLAQIDSRQQQAQQQIGRDPTVRLANTSTGETSDQ